MRDSMSPAQVAEYLRLDIDAVDRLIRDKTLPASEIGGTPRVRRADIDAYLLAHSSDPNLREALFARVYAIAERNGRRFPDLSSDELLDELEAADEQQHAPAPRG